MNSSLVDLAKAETPSQSNRAKIRVAALNLLARREHSRLELQQKLERKFPDSLDINDEVQKLVDQNLLSDQRFTESFIRMRQRQGKGPKQIAQELRIRGLDETLFNSLLSNNEIDWVQNAEQVYLKKFGDLPAATVEEKMKRQRFLASRGFSSDQIRMLSAKYFRV